jgi:hypothetical protein
MINGAMRDEMYRYAVLLISYNSWTKAKQPHKDSYKERVSYIFRRVEIKAINGLKQIWGE